MRRLLIVVALFAVGCGGTSASVEPSGFTESEVEELAYDVCQQAVEMELRAPATAEWPSLDEVTVVARPNRRYDVEGFVDSQNGFGALIRSDVYCGLRQVGESDRFRVLGLRVT